MTAVKINFHDLDEAAQKARDVASSLDSYADALPGKINSPLNSLPGGASAYTSNAASLATHKAKSLRHRADAYKHAAQQIASFADRAQSTDDRVGKRLTRYADAQFQDLNFFDKIGYLCHRALNGKFGATEMGAYATRATSAVNYLDKKRREIEQFIKDYFKHGDGRYYLGNILAFASVVSTAVGLGSALLAGGPLIIAAALIGFAVAVGVYVATSLDSDRALSTSDTEPGVARYYGSTSSLEDWAKKNTTSRLVQDIAHGLDVAGFWAGLFSTASGFFQTTNAAGETVYRFSKDVFKENLLKEAGFNTIRDESGTVTKIKFSLGHLFGIGDGEAPKNILDAFKNVFEPIENVVKTVQWAIECDGKFDFDDVKRTLKVASKVFPAVKVPGDIADVIDLFGGNKQRVSVGAGSW